LKHTSLSCAQYHPGDSIGKLLAHVSLCPVLLLCFQLSKVYTRRELHEAVLLVGLVLEEGVARALKHLMKHPRPATCSMLNLCHSHGMPSSHTSMMFAYLAVSSCIALQLSRQRGTVSRVLAAAEQLALAAAAVGVGCSRVYLGYHSGDQVLAGALLGSVFGVAWFGVLRMLAPLYGVLASWRMLQRLGVKDTWGVGEPLAVE
ncbi:phosphatidic acid phosphatase type 2/haloperoxidase, partial [Scenedesmus sp. NREL 46B-D3]